MRLKIRAELKFSAEERRVIDYVMLPGRQVAAAQIESDEEREEFQSSANRAQLQIMNPVHLRHAVDLKAILTKIREALLRDFHAWSEAADSKQRVPLAANSSEAMRVLADTRAQQSEKCKEALRIVEAAIVQLQHAEQECRRLEDAASLKPWDKNYME
tara:strand:+ start:132 stop:605 length:474 start_codon:yes stop_codon:yes gene_type:complete